MVINCDLICSFNFHVVVQQQVICIVVMQYSWYMDFASSINYHSLKLILAVAFVSCF